MTEHRLIRSTCTEVMAEAARVHASDQPGRGGDRVVPQWRYRKAQVAGRIAWGHAAIPGRGVVSWCLEIEPGANGVLAHLSAVPASGPLTQLPTPLVRLTMQAWATRELAQLARTVEH